MAPSPASPQFRIAISRALGTVVVTVHGDLDVAAARHLGAVLADLTDGQGKLAVVVDLHAAATPDPAALGVFVAAAERAIRRGAALSVSAPPDLLYQSLQLLGLGQLLRTTLGNGHNGHRPSPSAPFGRIAAPQWFSSVWKAARRA